MPAKSDISGILISVGCLFHCVLLPYFVTGLSFWGINILHNLFVELLLVCGAGLMGFRSFHRTCTGTHNRRARLLFIGGFTVLVGRLYFQAYEITLSAIALTLIIAAHTWNYVLSRKHCVPK